MLKRLVRHRLLLAALFFVLLACALMVPLRREYSGITDPAPCSSCSGTNLLTEVHYGTPMTWLTLSKEVDAADHQRVIAHHRQIETVKLALDVLFWTVVMGVGGYLIKITAIKPTLRTRRI